MRIRTSASRRTSGFTKRRRRCRRPQLDHRDVYGNERLPGDGQATPDGAVPSAVRLDGRDRVPGCVDVSDGAISPDAEGEDAGLGLEEVGEIYKAVTHVNQIGRAHV